ncbi:histidine phosphatase family protein [Amycolatopsis sp. NPDC098790]|uniref:histidine phosphatase family protein n=1 Tax=Amycolatopsis sp. NPDC098790 TaxID=3363939 RepID=UPI0037F14B7F
MTARLMFIRHGETDANAAALLKGRSDSRLLPESPHHATALGESLTMAGPFAAYSSRPRCTLPPPG